MHYRLTFDLDSKNEIPGRNLSKVVNFLILVLCAEIVAIFEPKVVAISARNTYNNEKICKLCEAIFSTLYNIFQPNVGILLRLKGSFREFRFFLLDLCGSKISLIMQIVYSRLSIPY